MASFASSATTFGARKHAWTNRSKYKSELYLVELNTQKRLLIKLNLSKKTVGCCLLLSPEVQETNVITRCLRTWC